ncbi:MAG: glycosyltransferase [Actinobacteria bacterium]|uniref:Unannotated protein n=1 Tax=freshwater metagenome TaxID=449393 RepID=A0A6J7CMJ5_9ZZZZ|nr:glycosyltransferase [Actinomycetota bacterium]
MGDKAEKAPERTAESKASRASGIRISVVVATRDRAHQVGVLLDALEGQSLPRDQFEIILVDDGSQDATADVVKGRVDVFLTNPASMGPAGARQRGWPEARGALVAFTDDDCRPEPTWLEEGLAAHLAFPGSVIQGKTRPDVHSDLDLRTPLARSIRVDHLGPFFETCNVFYPKALLERVGGFDQRIAMAGEDADLAMRSLATGCGAVFAENAVVNHSVEIHSFERAMRGTRRWASLVPLVKSHPHLRGAFPWRGYVWRESHSRLIVAVAGLVLARLTGRRAFLLWALPYITLRNGWYPDGLARTFSGLPKTLPVDAAEVAVLVKASIRERGFLI